MRFRKDILLVAGMMLIAAVSCQSPDEPAEGPEIPASPQPIDPTVLSFKAHREALTSCDPIVKSSFVSDTQIQWDLYDKLTVFDGVSRSGCLAITERNGMESLFVTASASLDADRYLMVYPYCEASDVSYEHSTATFTIPAEQVADECGADMEYAYALAKGGKGTDDFTFRNAFAVLKVSVAGVADGVYSQIETEAPNASLNGTFTVDYSADDLSVSEVTSGSAKVVLKSAGAALAAGSYYILVAPGTYPEGVRATVISAQGGEDVQLVADGSLTLAPGQIYDLGKAFTPGFKALYELPYCLSLFGAGTDNVGKWVNVEREGSTTSEYNMYLTDKDDNGVYLHCKEAGKAGFAASTTAIKANAKTGGQIRGSYFVTDQESFYKLAVPVAFEMPSSIIVSFGAYAKNAYQKWQLQYSKDDKTWFNAKDFNFVKNNNTYPIVSLRIDFASDFSISEGDVLYLRLIPRAANNYILGGGKDIWNTGHAVWLWGGIAIQPVVNRDTDVPSDAVYFEAFDSCNGGVDYLLGGKPSGREKLATLANAHGDAVTGLNGLEAVNTVERPGYVQLGHTAENWTYATAPIVCSTGKVTTPALETTGSLSLSFKAMAYRKTVSGDSNADGTGDANSIVVNILGGGTFDGGKTTMTVAVSDDKWDTLTYNITGATAATQIEFTSPSSATTTRWFLDEIYVKAF